MVSSFAGANFTLHSIYCSATCIDSYVRAIPHLLYCCGTKFRPFDCIYGALCLVKNTSISELKPAPSLCHNKPADIVTAASLIVALCPAAFASSLLFLVEFSLSDSSIRSFHGFFPVLLDHKQIVQAHDLQSYAAEDGRIKRRKKFFFRLVENSSAQLVHFRARLSDSKLY